MTRNIFLESFSGHVIFHFAGLILGKLPISNYMKYKHLRIIFSGHETHYMILNDSQKQFFRPVIFLVRMVIRENDNRGSQTHPKSRNTKKNTAFTRTFLKSLCELFAASL